MPIFLFKDKLVAPETNLEPACDAMNKKQKKQSSPGNYFNRNIFRTAYLVFHDNFFVLVKIFIDFFRNVVVVFTFVMAQVNAQRKALVQIHFQSNQDQIMKERQSIPN